jgi:leucyl/phenylalanyl-tRNA--protein transferase
MEDSIHWLAPDDPPDSFPDIEQALDDPDGLLAVGGDLSADRLLAAYRHGIFPWYNEGQPILWWSPNPRAVLFPQEFHISRSLRRNLRRGIYTVSMDQCFDQVIGLCASSRADTGTWITDEMIQAYRHLHELGHAHSIETWKQDELVGGVYGVAAGKIFFGESMFSVDRDASKVALAALIKRMQRTGDQLLDCQIASDHLARLGMRLIPRQSFLSYVKRYIDTESAHVGWKQPRQLTAGLA